MYLRARYYDAGVGAFTSEDPAKDGLNWYVYCGGNPVNYWDPWGLDAIWITTGEKSVHGFAHTSLLVQDTRAAKWYYFYWGDKALYFEEVPWEKGAMSSLDNFNAWLTSKNLRDNSTGYTTATFIEGNFNDSVDYFKNLKEDTNVRLLMHSQKDEHGKTHFVSEFKNESYDVLTNNCFHQSLAGFRKGTLYDGTNAGDFIGQLSIPIPNSARKAFQYGFANARFTRAAARNDIEWEVKHGTDTTYRRMITQYASSIGIYK